jgi:hypothetical protein
MWMEAAVAKFEVLSQYLPKATVNGKTLRTVSMPAEI